MKRFLSILKTQTIKDSLIVFCGLGVTAVLGFIYTILMARTLRPESFGVFSAITSLVAIVYSLGDLGIGPAIISFLPKHSKNAKSLIDSTFWFQYLVGIVVTISFWLVAKHAGRFVPGSLPEHFFLVGSLTFNYILVGWSQAIFTAQKNFFRLSLSQIIDAVIKIILVLYLFKIGELSTSTALIANCVSALLALMITFWRKLLIINLDFDKKTFIQVYHYSKWIAVSRFFSVFFSRIDIILLNLLATSYAAGIFAAASRVTLLFAMIVSSLGSVINPRFAQFGSKKEATSYIKKLFLLISGISLIILATVVFAKPLILTVFGISFFESILVFQLLAISMIPFLYSVIFTAAILYTFRKTSFYALTSVLQFALVILVNLIFIPKIGIYAPVLASAVSNIFVFILTSIKLKSLFAHESISS